MAIYEVSYELNYTHRLTVAVDACTPAKARALMQDGLGEDTLLDKQTFRLIEDIYEEADAGRTMKFSVKQVKDWPIPTLSARALHRDKAAVAFVRQVALLTKHGDLGQDGLPFIPPDGTDDSHEALMRLVDVARTILDSHRSQADLAASATEVLHD